MALLAMHTLFVRESSDSEPSQSISICMLDTYCDLPCSLCRRITSTLWPLSSTYSSPHIPLRNNPSPPRSQGQTIRITANHNLPFNVFLACHSCEDVQSAHGLACHLSSLRTTTTAPTTPITAGHASSARRLSPNNHALRDGTTRTSQGPPFIPWYRFHPIYIGPRW